MGTGAISKLVGEDDYKNMQSTVAEELKKDKSAADLLTSDDAVNEVKKLRAFFNDTYCKIQLGIEEKKNWHVAETQEKSKLYTNSMMTCSISAMEH